MAYHKNSGPSNNDTLYVCGLFMTKIVGDKAFTFILVKQQLYFFVRKMFVLSS